MERVLLSVFVKGEHVLSPIRFTVYIDDLLVDLSNLGVGWFWDSLYAGVLCYADDLVLLAPSPSALRIMLCCCEDFALKRGLRFNSSKTQLIRFFSSPSFSCAAHIHLCGHKLPFLDSVTHLGHILQYNLSDTPDINLKLKDMVLGQLPIYFFPRVGPLIWLICFGLTVFRFMVLVSGYSPLLPFTTLRLPLTRSCTKSETDISIITVIRPLFTLLLSLIAS